MHVFDPSLLRAAREAAGTSREQLAIDIGRTYNSIVKYENGAGTPTIQTLTKLALVLGVEPGDLFGYEVVPDAGH